MDHRPAQDLISDCGSKYCELIPPIICGYYGKLLFVDKKFKCVPYRDDKGDLNELLMTPDEAGSISDGEPVISNDGHCLGVPAPIKTSWNTTLFSIGALKVEPPKESEDESRTGLDRSAGEVIRSPPNNCPPAAVISIIRGKNAFGSDIMF
jgi:hypothetical protein